jgi:DNA (cytosine-5)-methyltransferase 1
MIKIATAFSGIGSPEMALKRLEYDHEVVFACEIDKFARQSYKAIYEIDDDIFYTDVCEVDGTRYKDVDLFVFGFPCQTYSMAGKREGLESQRGTLFYEGARITKEMRPKYFIAENVKGLLSSNEGQDFETIMEILRHDVGYHCTYAVLNTKDYGIPQNRERVFIVGFSDDLHHEYISYEYPKPFKLEKRLKDVLEDEVDEKYYLSDKLLDTFQRLTERENGFRFEPHSKDDESCKTLTARYFKSGTSDPYIKEQKVIENKIKIPSDTKCGYEVAQEGDSINLSVPNSKTMRGRVGKGVAQTLDTQCKQGVIYAKSNSEVKKRYNGVIKKGDIDEKSTYEEKNSVEILRILWEEAREKTFEEWGLGIYDPFQQEEILQSRLYGEELCEGRGEQSDIFTCSRNFEIDEEAFYNEEQLRKMWCNWKTGYSSYRRKLSEQFTGKLDGIVQKLSHEDTQTKKDMQSGRMRNKSEGSRILRKALSEIQKMGESSQNKEATKQDYRIRKLVPIETWRLQGFPDWSHDKAKASGVSDSQLYKQAGNSITVDVMMALIKSIYEPKKKQSLF